MAGDSKLDGVIALVRDREPAPGLVVARSGLIDRAEEPELDRWTSALRSLTCASVAAFSLLEQGHVLVKSMCTSPGSAKTSARIELSDSLEEFLFAQAGAGGSIDPPRAYLQAPVTVGGRVIGWMSIVDDATRDWDDRDRQVLETVAAAASTEVELSLAREEAAGVQELVASHNRVHDLIARAAPLSEVLEEIVASIERHDPSIIGCVVLLDRESSTLHPGAGPSLPPHYLAAIDGVVIGPNVGTCGSAAWSGQLTISHDMEQDPKWAPIRELVKSAGLGHCWSMPIKAPAGDVLGTLAFYGHRPRHPSPEQLTLLQDWARIAGIAIERHGSLERLLHDARHDGLTGLPNRIAIFETLDQALAGVSPEALVAVLFIDLDGLKALNDTLGHDHADEMIREIGNRLAGAVRAHDFVGRFGGDEFVVIAKDISGHEAAAQLGLRLLDAVSHPLPGLDSTVATASVGITMIRSENMDAREAIRQADAAMYAAKRSGRDRCAFFDGTQRVRTARRLLLARALRGAESRDELSLVFQPVLELLSDRIVGVEALVRWSNPTVGEVMPGEFIPIAEDTGSIVPVGAWVLRESCETIARIAQELGRPLELAVNVSTHQLSNPGFALAVQRTVAHAEFPPNMLTLEITETALMRPHAATAQTLRELDSSGVRIVLDDFGTGYSSLCWLKQHPLGAIKIDRSFIKGLPDDHRDQAIIAAMIGMAQALGATITAVGVENHEQLAALRELGCERVQGFLLARPLADDRLADLLKSSLPRTRAA